MSKGAQLFRWKIALPLSIAVVAVSLYVFFLLDAQMRSFLEGVATDMNGAEVNIGRLRTSIIGASIEIEKVQFTDPERPEHNRLELGKLRFEMDMGAALRAKAVIRDATLQDVQIASRRDKPGRVLPPPPPEPEGPGLTEKAKELFEPVKQELMQNALGILKEKGLENPLQSIDWQEMPSTQAIKSIQASLEQKPAEWKALTDQLPKADSMKALKGKLQGLQAGDSDPEAIQKRLADLQELQKEASVQVTLVQELGQKLKSDVQNLSGQIKGLDSLAKQDLALVQQKLKWPDLDFKGLAEELCGPEIKRYMRLLEGYYNKVKPFLEKKAQPAPSKPLRLAGTDYRFPVRNGLPSFWLQKMQLSSKATADGPLGNILGSLSDLSSDPGLLVQPTRLSLEGSFPSQHLEGMKLEAVLDHRKPESEDRLLLELASFPISEKVLSQSSDFVLGVHQADGKLKLDFTLRGESIDLALTSQMRKLVYRVESGNTKIKGFLDQALAPVQDIEIKASASGPWQSLAWKVQSNLSDQLRGSFRNVLTQELAAVQEKLRSAVQERIQLEQKKLEDALREKLGPYEKQVLGSEGEAKGLQDGVDGQKNQLNAALEGKKAAAQAALDAEKKKAEEAAAQEKKKQEDKAKQELKKKLKFP